MPTAATTLLAIDTAGDACTLALWHAGGTALERGAPGQTHLEHVMPLVRQLFERQGLRPAACDAFAFGSGPGSFTGLRVACTIAQGLAYGAQRPVIAVGNLQALARQAAALAGPATDRPIRVLAAIDARMAQAYWAVFEGAGDRWRMLAPPALCDESRLAAVVRQWQPRLCAGRSAWLQALVGDPAPALQDAVADAGAVLCIAREDLARGAVLPPQQAAPVYVRDDVARTVEQRRAAAAAAAAT